MHESEFYFVVERHNGKAVCIYKINVGVRRIGLNNAVRSLMALGRFELDNFTNYSREHGMFAERPVSFDVKSDSQFEMMKDQYAQLAPLDKVKVVECATVHDLYRHIGYDRVKKVLTPPHLSASNPCAPIQ